MLTEVCRGMGIIYEAYSQMIQKKTVPICMHIWAHTQMIKQMESVNSESGKKWSMDAPCTILTTFL